MRADENYFRAHSANFDFEIMAGVAIYLVSVSPQLEASSRKGILNELNCAVELRVTDQVTFADLSAEHFNVSSQFLAQLDFVSGQRRRAPNIFARHPHSEPPKQPEHNNDRADD